MSEYRTRNFATVIYSDENLKLLEELKIPCLVSPWHKDDINPTGEKKKPHRHVILMYDSVKTQKQARDDISEFGGVGCECVKSMRAYARYLCHLDNPEKAQYDTGEVLSFGGVDYFGIIESASDEFEILDNMTVFIIERHILNFPKFVIWTRQNRPDWYRMILLKQTYFIKELIKSNKYNIDSSGEIDIYPINESE